MNRDLLQKIIEAGVQAPSGSNSQPWRFEVDGNRIAVVALPEKDHPILNYRFRGTWLALGALLENMTITAQALGASASFALFPDALRPTVVAHIVLGEARPASDTLYPYIALRATNRKAFEAAPLSAEQRAAFQAITTTTPEVKVRWVEDEKNIKAIGKASSTAEICMLENKQLHNLFFHEIVWSREEERARGGGLYIDTMELKPPQKFALKNILRHWPLMRLFITIGFPRIIASENGTIYGKAGAMGIITVPDKDFAFLEAGKIMERLWLTATQAGLGFHLLTGVPFLYQRIANEGEAGFSKEHAELVRASYGAIKEAGAVPDGETIAVVFRVGKDGEPTARSYKKSPEIDWHS